MNRTKIQSMRHAGIGAVALIGLVSLGGCNNAGEGLLSGGAAGAGAGAIIGSLVGHAGTGAAIGAVAGGLTGAVIGDQNERNASAPGYVYPAPPPPPPPTVYYAYPPPPPPGYRVYVYDRNGYGYWR